MNKWNIETEPLRVRRLGKLLEELGELGKEVGELSAVASRCIIQGIDEVDPSSQEVNRTRPENELADVMAQCVVTIRTLQLNAPAISERCARKETQMAEWEALYSVSQSQIDEANKNLMAAATKALAALREHQQWHQDHDEYGGFPGSQLCVATVEAINACSNAIYEAAGVPEPDTQQHSHAASVDAAIRTLAQLGYSYHGAEYWKPPISEGARTQASFEAAVRTLSKLGYSYHYPAHGSAYWKAPAQAPVVIPNGAWLSMLSAIDKVARGYEKYEYSLPMGSPSMIGQMATAADVALREWQATKGQKNG